MHMLVLVITTIINLIFILGTIPFFKERMLKEYLKPYSYLKRGNQLILGNGKIETYMGASYFAKGKPIDFDNVKFKFISVDCIDKK